MDLFIIYNITYRNHWIKNNFNRKQPMSSGSKSDRSSTYTNGVLTSLGVAHPGSPHTRRTPGPGYYSPSVTQFSPVSQLCVILPLFIYSIKSLF